MTRIYLSPPDTSPADKEAIERAFEGGWIAPLGPEVDAFEAELAAVTGRSHGVALSSGTAALHLALLLEGIGAGKRVAVSTLTFASTVNALRYVGATPVFIDCSRDDWNMDPKILDAALSEGGIDAVVAVDIYGQVADYESIGRLCEQHGVPLIEDAAEALGATRHGKPAGSFGVSAALSFNGNKIITTSGGGALMLDDGDLASRARFLATQARDDAPHYQHSVVGYNYRLSNLLAALGRSQLADLDRRVAARRDNNLAYRRELSHLPGVEFMPEAEDAHSTFWLTCLTIDPSAAGANRDDVRLHLESIDIEARPVWKPMHLQPVFESFDSHGGDVAADLFVRGLCLPSGSSLTEADRDRVVAEVTKVLSR